MKTIYCTYKLSHTFDSVAPIAPVEFAGSNEAECRARAVKYFARHLARSLYGSLAVVQDGEIDDDQQLGVVFADAGFFNEESEDFDNDVFDFRVNLIHKWTWGGWA